MELFSFLFEGNEIAGCHETFHLYFSMILVKLLRIVELDEIDK